MVGFQEIIEVGLQGGNGMRSIAPGRGAEEGSS